MAAMGLMLLFPTRRILRRSPMALLAVFADDRNAVTVADEEMDIIESAWRDAERSSALLNNAT
eukprot:9633494-Alexandrium_andersonii.AAC.1